MPATLAAAVLDTKNSSAEALPLLGVQFRKVAHGK